MAGHFSILHDSWRFTYQWPECGSEAFGWFQQFLVADAMWKADKGISFVSGNLLLPYRFEHEDGICDGPFHVIPMPLKTQEDCEAALGADLHLPNRDTFRCDWRDMLEAPVTLLSSIHGYLSEHSQDFWPHLPPEERDVWGILGDEQFELLVQTDGNARDCRTRLYLLSIVREGVSVRRLSRGKSRIVIPREREGPSPFSREGLLIVAECDTEDLSFGDKVLPDGRVRGRQEAERQGEREA